MKDAAENPSSAKARRRLVLFPVRAQGLIAATAKQFIKQSLGTSGLTEAKRLRTIHDLNSDALFMAAEKDGVGSGKGSKHPVLHWRR